MSSTGIESALVWFGDADGHCAGCNEAWLAWRGHRLDDELGDGWLEGVHPQDRSSCAWAIARHTALRSPFEMEFRLRRSDGAWRTMLAVAVPRVDHSGEFCGLTCSLIDATEHLPGRRTGRPAQALLRATLEAARDSGLLGTAEGASVHRIATFLAADRPHAVEVAESPAAGEAPLVEVTAFDRAQRRAAGGTGDVAVVACALEPVPEPLSKWARSELRRITTERLTSHLRARDAVIDCGDEVFGVLLSDVCDSAGAEAAIDVLHEVLEHPLEIGGTPIQPRLRFTYVIRQPGEDLPGCVDRARQALGPAAMRAG